MCILGNEKDGSNRRHEKTPVTTGDLGRHTPVDDATLSNPEEVTNLNVAGFLAPGLQFVLLPRLLTRCHGQWHAEVSFPVTVAGPRRILTGFPF